MMCRQNGRSHFGILDDVESSFSLLDIPFTDINNIVGSQSYFNYWFIIYRPGLGDQFIWVGPSGI